MLFGLIAGHGGLGATFLARALACTKSPLADSLGEMPDGEAAADRRLPSVYPAPAHV